MFTFRARTTRYSAVPSPDVAGMMEERQGKSAARFNACRSKCRDFPSRARTPLTLPSPPRRGKGRVRGQVWQKDSRMRSYQVWCLGILLLAGPARPAEPQGRITHDIWNAAY